MNFVGWARFYAYMVFIAEIMGASAMIIYGITLCKVSIRDADEIAEDPDKVCGY